MVSNPFAKTIIIENGHYQSITVRLTVELVTTTVMVLQKVILPGKHICVCLGNIVPKNSIRIDFMARLTPGGGDLQNYNNVRDVNNVDVLLSSSSKIVLGYAGRLFGAQTSTARNTIDEMRAFVQIREAVRKFGSKYRGVRIHPVAVNV